MHAQTFAAAREGNSKDADSLATLSKDVDILVDALASEATAYAMDESTGPCLEYMVRRKCTRWLIHVCRTDVMTAAHK